MSVLLIEFIFCSL